MAKGFKYESLVSCNVSLTKRDIIILSIEAADHLFLLTDDAWNMMKANAIICICISNQLFAQKRQRIFSYMSKSIEN